MFWDSSAVVPELVSESSSPVVVTLLRSDPAVTLWWASPVECQSAIYCRDRDGALPEAGVTEALTRLRMLVLHVAFATRLAAKASRCFPPDHWRTSER